MQSKIVFITGCSSGIGCAAALALSKRGHKVIASCRKDDDVKALLDLKLDVIQMDMNDSQSITTGFKHLLTKTEGRLDVLINNAGYGQAGALEDLDRTTLRRQFETNVFGLMELTRLAIPVMRQQGQGRIINLSSVLGIISLPFRGAYNASKYAVEGISDTLRLELKPSGIAVICIQPGPINSQFRDNSVESALKEIDMENSHFKVQYQRMLGEFRQSKNESLFTRSPDAVIRKLIHAIESKKPKGKYPVTFPAHFLAILKRILSTKMLDRLLLMISKKELG
ncbi:SDR family NAD(P)-dependent oxidoreductase [Legionella oakridgensis]|uniref:Short-chain dehydrogenase of various substrate specificities n=2 Tax=Legionella oakridgensis TaxID=29423 RepID=W0BC11_9GAMM|nr:SDR family NAD(P)-dependent oxidoreductase [Legionella oakridgensis]AHE68073.1 short-chain dehydrogenase of various substrate specificities [Legionella oakridgensis ATCC 33761 = DSM 21215]ETO92419.1 short-chain dehydrogenase of various substrate specificities [Legionella oakridgensis RV-2-2007]KTD44534.1 oxidoreductase with NAD(P)-binding Rossmann-fold domain protein [Legionella oakridgensis]STY21055.1 oxidoreductase with NAD(P)-binding Rossmann-fold domain [Legionella longbeachae]